MKGTVKGGLREVAAVEPAVTGEDLRDLAIQAVLLPNILAKSQIEQLGLAVLAHLRHQDDGQAAGGRRSSRLDQPYRLVAVEDV